MSTKILIASITFMLLSLAGCSPTATATATEKTSQEPINVVTSSTNNPVADTVKQCASCHNNLVDLTGVPAAELPAMIKKIVEGKSGHPTPIPKLTDEQLGELGSLLHSL